MAKNLGTRWVPLPFVPSASYQTGGQEVYSASSFESRMLTFLLFSFHIRRTRGPRKMIFVFVIINPLSQCMCRK